MPNYRRAFIPGGTWFFTVNLLERHRNDLLVREIELLREAVRRVRARYPFQINARVVLPDHLHCVWTLPPDDADYSARWRLIKSGFSRALPRFC
jgi:putative transposase